ncbi:hypothetical protein BSLG_002172 [Batrachochytrium salamandrivorans]|nr:hypothetical protein BSLG_002172 [Batrachochytrium salamandrivorans]
MLRPSAFPGSENVRSTTTYTVSGPGKKDVPVVQALFSYIPQQPDELAFQEGDILYVLDRTDANWWKCRAGDKEGMVPSNYFGENTTQIDNPLHEAAKRGNLSFVIELLDAGVSVNGLDKAGNAPLHWACRGGHSEVVAHLLAHSPAVNAGNKLGDTPLHLAAWGGNVSVVDLLLAHPETRVDIRNNSGSTPLDLAKSDGVAAALLNFIGAGGADGLMGDDDEDDNEDDTGIHPEAVPHK